jgi:hypothetical protein
LQVWFGAGPFSIKLHRKFQHLVSIYHQRWSDQQRIPRTVANAKRWAKVWKQAAKKLHYCIFTKRLNMIIERTSKEVVFRLPSSTKLEDLQEIADLFAFKEISTKSKATQKDVDNLVKEVKKGRWAKTKKRLGL